MAKRNVSLRITQPVKILKLLLFPKNAVKTSHFTFVTFDSMIGWSVGRVKTLGDKKEDHERIKYYPTQSLIL